MIRILLLFDLRSYNETKIENCSTYTVLATRAA
jgi:hypothetical protein